MWGSGIGFLTKNTSFSIPHRRSSLFSWPSSSQSPSALNNIIEFMGMNSMVGTFKELVDTLNFRWEQTGGLYDFSNPSMTCQYRNKHTFTASRSKSKKGVEATLWDVPQWRSNCKGTINKKENSNSEENHKRLLVFNTHLDPWHPKNRRKQIEEILDFMEETLLSIESTVPLNLSEEIQREQHKYDWSKTAVLVVGDFNIKACSEEYWKTLEFIESSMGKFNRNHGWKDYFYRQGETVDNTKDQHTYALQNSLVEYPNDCGRIDYVFGIPHFTKQSTTNGTSRQEELTRVFMPLDAVSRFIRHDEVGAECSDHYALVLELIPAL